jgi:hypothetical protein
MTLLMMDAQIEANKKWIDRCILNQALVTPEPHDFTSYVCKGGGVDVSPTLLKKRGRKF